MWASTCSTIRPLHTPRFPTKRPFNQIATHLALAYDSRPILPRAEFDMTVSPQGISIQSLYRSYRDGSLIVNRQYQRKLVWTIAEKQKLIDSILKDYPLPLFLLAEKSSSEPGKPSRLEVIDGMQRLNAIFSYI